MATQQQGYKRGRSWADGSSSYLRFVVTPDDEHRLSYALNEIEGPDPFARSSALPKELLAVDCIVLRIVA